MDVITLKQLRYFDALARYKHFGRAAEACSITQPALSQQIKELETVMGSALVERGSRQIRLTRLGEALVPRAQAILVGVDELGELMRASQTELSGSLRLGVIPTVAPYLLPNIMRALSQRFSELELDLREAVTRSLIDQLEKGRLDAAIVALPISEVTLQEFALFEEDFVLVRADRDAHLPVPSPQMLQAMRLLLLEEGHCFRDQALAFCQIGHSQSSQAQPPMAQARQVMEGSSLSTLVQMVGAGLGVTLVPEMALALETRSANVSIARFPQPAPSRTIGMVWRKSNPLAAQLMQIGAIVRGVGQDTAKLELAL